MALFQSWFAPPRDLLLVVGAGWAGLLLAERRATRSRVNVDALSSLLLISLAAYLAGGRLLYLLENLTTFLQSPSSLFSLHEALFDSWGALACAAVAGYAYGWRVHLPFWPSLDALTPFFGALAVGIALSHLASGAAFGQATGVPWAVDEWGALRHPTQVYELIGALLALGVVLGVRKWNAAGQPFLVFAALSAAARLVVEGFRGDSTLIVGGLRAAQIAAWCVLALALVGLELRARNAEAPAPPKRNGRPAKAARRSVL